MRQQLTERGVDFVAKQVAAEPNDRDAMRAETDGTDSIPLLVLEDGRQIDDTKEILRYLAENHPRRDDGARHREKLREEADERATAVEADD